MVAGGENQPSNFLYWQIIYSGFMTFEDGQLWNGPNGNNGCGDTNLWGHPCGEERGRRGMGMAYDNKVHVGSGDY